MARRRRKENGRRHSLVFTESPVENGLCIITPVRADNPAAVSRVSALDETSVTWVSPQFRGVATSHGKHRQARGRHHCGPSIRLRSLNKENTFARSFQPGTRRQFPALKFLGGPVEATPPSDHHRLSHDSQNPTQKVKRQSYVRPKHRPKGRIGNSDISREQKEVNRACVQVCEENRWLENSVASLAYSPEQNEDGSLYENCNYQGEQHQMSVSESDPNAGHTKSPIPNRKLWKQREQRKFSCASPLPSANTREPVEKQNQVQQEYLTVTPPCDIASGVGTENQKSKRKLYNSDILHSPLESESGSFLCEKQKHNSTATDKRPLNYAFPLHPSPSDVGFARVAVEAPVSDDQLFHAVGNQSLFGSDTHSKQGTPHRKSGVPSLDDDTQTPTRRRKHGIIGSPCGVRRSVRLREKYTEALRYLHPSTPSGSETELSSIRPRNSEFDVLVADTPESEYGLPFRRRQMKHCRKQKR